MSSSPTQNPSFLKSSMNTLTLWKNMLLQSVSNLDFYVEALNHPLRTSLAFVFFFYCVLGAISSVMFGVFVAPSLQDVTLKTFDSLSQQIPRDISYQWSGETLTSNAETPLNLQFEDENIITIDTVSENQTPLIDDAGFVYVNTQDIYIRNENAWEKESLKNLLGDEQQTFDYSLVEKAQSWRPNLVRFFQALPLIVFPIFSFGLFVLRLGMLLLDAFIVSFVFNIMKKPIPYWKVYQLLLHVLIPVEIITNIALILYKDNTFPIFGVSFWLLTAIIIWHLRNLHVVKFEKKEK